MAHSLLVLEEWDAFSKYHGDEPLYTLSGSNLRVSKVVAVSRYRVPIKVDAACLEAVASSAASLVACLEAGQIVYGVNTGFGGSADSRTNQVEELQSTAVREHHTGIGAAEIAKLAVRRKRPVRNGLPLLDPTEHLLPNAWVRASILIRINSLIAGNSGVRPVIVETLSQVLNHDVLPMIPLRGSISASGDLSPLSYIAGTIQGKSTLRVKIGSADGAYTDMTAAEALTNAAISPVKLAAKEGLAIVNGTAVSAGVAALAVWEAHQLAVIAQLLTCMSVEALSGTDESFNPLFGRVRPHPGQVDCANNMYRFLEQSKMACHNDGKHDSLRQDRYSVRTASQWVGPVLEDLLLAHQQVQTELNSVTDNPIMDRDTGQFMHGGNFQAKAITSAMEKVRQAMQSIGRMLFTQCTEIINPTTNRGLPPNLTAEDPSTSFLMKGVDIMVAALQSELGFLANPAGSHVQTAEMGNQSLNSLALISARYTHTAVDVLTQLVSAHLLVVCQALDLRVMVFEFTQALEPQLMLATKEAFARHIPSISDSEHPALKEIWSVFLSHLEQTTKLDAERRFTLIMESLQPVLFRQVNVEHCSTRFIADIKSWTKHCASLCLDTYISTREIYSRQTDATPSLGVASRRIYTFVRNTLQVPFLRSAHIQTPYREASASDTEENDDGYFSSNPDSHTIGTYISRIYEALRSGELHVPAMECLRGAQ